MKHVGKMIYSLRCEKNISQKKLAHGILSTAEISRIENDTKEASSLVVETLLQRLGKSLDRLEYMVSSDEYREICLKEMIHRTLADEDYGSAEMLLEEYEEYAVNGGVICRQYAMQIRAVTEYIKTGDTRQCYQNLKKALKLTCMACGGMETDNECLSTQEIQILLAMYYIQFVEQNDGTEKIERFVRYIDEHYTDKKEKAKIYPQAAWLAGKAAYAEGNFGKAYKLYQQGEACLSETGVLVLMDKILEDEIHCLEKLGNREDMLRKEKQLLAIDFLYESVKKKRTNEDILFFVLKSHQREAFISNELIREIREARGLSQERVSEGVCTQETLSRIETQKRKPKRKTVREIFDKLAYDRQFYQGFIVSDDYYAHELAGEINAQWYKKNSEDACRILKELEKILDLSIPVNRQYMEFQKLYIRIKKDKLSEEVQLKEVEKILSITMGDFRGIVYRGLSRMEFMIINYMAMSLRNMGKLAEAEELYRQALERYRNVAMDVGNHAMTRFLLYINYTGLLEVGNKLCEAEKLGWEGIGFMLDCQRGDVAASLLANIGCAYEKMDEKEKEELCFRYSYYLFLLYEHYKDADRMRKFYEDRFYVSID